MAMCPRCGAVIPENAQFCTSCGQSTERVNPARSPAPPPPMAAPPIAPPPSPAAAPPMGGFTRLSEGRSQPMQEAPPPTAAAPPTTGSSESEGMPAELRSFVSELEEWARLNQTDARHDTIRFWILKVPAILSSACAGVLAINHFETAAAILAAIATTCILIDGVNPGGQLRNAHVRAVHDLRTLQHQVVNDWRVGCLRGTNTKKLAAELLQKAEKVREQVAAALKGAETSFAKSVDTK